MAHRWSGWPGAWCLDCGTEDPIEMALADNCPCIDGLLQDEEKRACERHPRTACPAPGSGGHDPYRAKPLP